MFTSFNAFIEQSITQPEGSSQILNIPPFVETLITPLLSRDSVEAIRDFARETFPTNLNIETPQITVKITPHGTHLVTIQEKSLVEKFHYWLVKDYDFDFNTACKVMAFAVIAITSGGAYFAALIACILIDCCFERKKIELL